MIKNITIEDVEQIPWSKGGKSGVRYVVKADHQYSTFDKALYDYALENVGRSVQADVTSKPFIGKGGEERLVWNVVGFAGVSKESTDVNSVDNGLPHLEKPAEQVVREDRDTHKNSDGVDWIAKEKRAYRCGLAKSQLENSGFVNIGESGEITDLNKIEDWIWDR